MVHLFFIWFIFHSFGSFVLHLVYLFLIGFICPSFGAFVLHLVLCSSFVLSSGVGDGLSVEDLSFIYALSAKTKLLGTILVMVHLLIIWFICSSFDFHLVHLFFI